MNAKIYTKDMCYVVVGDVWGHGTNVGYGEFVRGDSVIWKGTGSTNYNKNGKIVAFKDQTTAIVEEDGGKRTEIKIKNPKCTICLIDFKDVEKVKIFSCLQHIFHEECIKNWLKNKNNCPICRKQL